MKWSPSVIAAHIYPHFDEATIAGLLLGAPLERNRDAVLDATEGVASERTNDASVVQFFTGVVDDVKRDPSLWFDAVEALVTAHTLGASDNALIDAGPLVMSVQQKGQKVPLSFRVFYSIIEAARLRGDPRLNPNPGKIRNMSTVPLTSAGQVIHAKLFRRIAAPFCNMYDALDAKPLPEWAARRAAAMGDATT
jgi:hypothetical protein